MDAGIDQLMELFDAKRWGDGLPLVPPTPDRVDAMLGAVPGGAAA